MNLLQTILLVGLLDGGRAFSSTTRLHTSTRIIPAQQHRSTTNPRGRNHLPSSHTRLFALQENEPQRTRSNSNGRDNWIDQFQSAQKEGFGTKAKNVASSMSIDDVVVPICGNLTKRQELANRGIYAGVEYLVCDLTISGNDDDNGEDNGDEGRVSVTSLEGLSSTQRSSATAYLKPNYPLRDYLERSDWPVSVNPVIEVPLFLSQTTYTAGTLVGTLSLAATYLTLAAIIASVVRLTYVPSESMLPALAPKSLVLVVRSIPFVNIDVLKPQVGSVILFDPPKELKEVIPNAQVWEDMGIQKGPASPLQGQQLLKRIVATPGEVVGVKNSSPYVVLGTTTTTTQVQETNVDANDSTSMNTRTVSKQLFRVDVTGAYAKPELFSETSWNRPADETKPLKRNEYFVAGDNGYRSVDSRVWGPLNQKYIFGTAKWILWPISDFGPVPDGQIYQVEK